jgi:hypothetical protein
MNTAWVKRLPVVAAVVMGASGGTALAQATSAAVDCSAMHFEIANPTPYSRVNPGNYIIQGLAVDGSAEDGTPGIDMIDFFLGSRDAGGFIVGHATPSSAGGLGPDSFETTITLPSTLGGQELYGYAHSSVTGEVGVVSVPIALGVDLNKAGDLQARTPVAECRVGSVDTGAPNEDMAPPNADAQMAPPEAQAEPSTDAGTPASSSTMYLDVGNPSPGDSVHVGAMIIEGIAFDSTSDSGPGIDHVDIFVDNRDQGGTLVGHGVLGVASVQPDDPNLAGAGWAAQVVIPTRVTGPHSLFFYALSSVTGEEMKVAIPVQIVP